MELFKAWQDYQKDAIYRTVVARRPDTRLFPSWLSCHPTLLFPPFYSLFTAAVARSKFPSRWSPSFCDTVSETCDRKFRESSHGVCVCVCVCVVTRFCLSLRFLANKLARSSHEWRHLVTSKKFLLIPANRSRPYILQSRSFVRIARLFSLAGFRESMAWLVGIPVSAWLVRWWNEVSTGCNVSCK